MIRFPLVELSGAHKERGRQYGEQARDLIHFNLDGYWRLFRHYTTLDRPAILEQVRVYAEPIRAYAPHVLDEIRGIAAGAGVTFEEILALNCRTELLSVNNVPLRECTAVFVAPERAVDGRTLLAQNWDWAELLRGGAVLLRVEQPSRPTILTLTEAGIVAKIGLNSAGIGACLNFLRHDHRRIGVPVHVILREALSADRLGLAAAAVYRAHRADAANYLLAHADGEAIDLEATPSDVGFLHPQDGWLIHTNHFLTPRLQAGDKGIYDSDSTLLRYGRALRLLKADAGPLAISTLKNLFCDHFNHPKGICRHPDPTRPEPEQDATLASMIVDLRTRQMHLCAGEPCQGEYYTVDLGK